jgi:hypothetical protein
VPASGQAKTTLWPIPAMAVVSDPGATPGTPDGPRFSASASALVGAFGTETAALLHAVRRGGAGHDAA